MDVIAAFSAVQIETGLQLLSYRKNKSDADFMRQRRKVFRSMEKVLTTRSISMPTKLHLWKCYVWSTLLYGCEGWTISNIMRTRLEATELWFLRRMMRISWTDKLTNDVVLLKADTQRSLLKAIISRQIRF